MKIYYTFILLAFSVMSAQLVSGQGCVAIRGNSFCGGNYGSTYNFKKGEFNVGAGYRYFKSDRHFRGSEEETHRQEEGTEVINHSHFLDLGLNYGITDRLFAGAIVPFVFHSRTSMYEHGGNPPNGLGERHETTSSGLGDIRLNLGYWIFEPGKHNFNYSVGLGVKLPTGDYGYTDLFYNQGENRDEDVEKVVDQSIQPGDGGTGITLDIQGFHALSSKFSLTANLYYMANVTETNGQLTRSGRSEFSCPDQYAVRIGGSFASFSGFNAYLGGRLEGVPSNDVIGGSAGYRRPGYAISAEPGFGYFSRRFSVFASVPIALYRNRTQSYQDKERTMQTGVYRHGDAAFADYLLNLTFAYRFQTGRGHGNMMMGGHDQMN